MAIDKVRTPTVTERPQATAVKLAAQTGQPFYVYQVVSGREYVCQADEFQANEDTKLLYAAYPATWHYRPPSARRRGR